MKQKVICPVCFSDQVNLYLKTYNQHGKTLLQHKEKFSYCRCTNCQTVFLTGVAFTKNYYQQYYTFPEVTEQSSIKNKLEKFLNKKGITKKIAVIEELVDNHKGKIHLLDIGCGAGDFLASLDNKKYNAVGIEKDKKEYTICKQKNLTVYNADIYNHNFAGEKFDVITLWHVIEHIPDPHKLLKKVKTLLKKNGVLIMATPNADSLGFKYAKEKWFHLDAPRHIILYGKKGMEELSIRNGLDIKKQFSQTFEFPLDLFWSINHLPIKYLFYPLYPLMKKMSQETITYVLIKSDEK